MYNSGRTQFVEPLLLSAYWAFWATVCKTVRSICYRTVVCPVCL